MFYVAILVAVLFGQSLPPKPTPNAAVFNDVKVLIQEGEKRKDVEAFLRFEADSLVVQPKEKKQAAAERTFPYADIKSGEYSFGKSPRVSAALLVSPFFLFSASKSHWLTVKTADDYALLRLDKSNYKLVIAELEKRAHITVASIGENK